MGTVLAPFIMLFSPNSPQVLPRPGRRRFADDLTLSEYLATCTDNTRWRRIGRL
jgi:hypothetical protein